MIRFLKASALIFLAFQIAPAAAGEPKPLFLEDSVLNITITAPFKDLAKNAPQSTDPYPAVLTLAGDTAEEHAIALSARGNSRRNKNLCDFPPLRVQFNEKPEDISLFDGQKRLKLVTHCRSSKRYQQYYLLEYTAYKLLNIMTPASLHVRMAKIDYVETETGKLFTSRYGFFIEDTDDAAKRNGLKEIDIGDITITQLNSESAALYSLFQYMIGNLDWSMHDGVAGEECCHNSKLIGNRSEPLSGLIPVPYDFDYSGLVNAPYAVPPETVRVRSVRSRRYRGFCTHNDAAQKAAAEFRNQQAALLAVLDTVPGLEKSKRKSTQRYLDDFFENIAQEKLESRVLDDCRS